MSGRVGFRRDERRPVEGWRVSTAWKKVIRIVKARAGYRCEVCGAPEVYHRSQTGRRMSNLIAGHRTPPERYPGSPLDLANLYCLCRACNSSQSNRPESEWRAARSGRLVELGIAKTPSPASQVNTGDYTKREPGMEGQNLGGSSPQTAIAPDACADDIGKFYVVEKPQ